MNISGIISIAGKPGLYKVLSRNKTGLVVESLIDNKKLPVHASSKVSALEDISMYTYAEDIPLREVFEKIFDHTEGKEAINPKKASKDELYEYFRLILEDFDEDRVYPSDLKKLFAWYNMLLAKGVLKKEDAEASVEKEEVAEEKEAE